MSMTKPSETIAGSSTSSLSECRMNLWHSRLTERSGSKPGMIRNLISNYAKDQKHKKGRCKTNQNSDTEHA